MDTIAQFIEEAQSRAKALNYTPHQVLAIARVTPANWDNWLAGRNLPSGRIIRDVEAALTQLESARSRKRSTAAA